MDGFDATVTAGQTTEAGDLVQDTGGDEGTDHTTYYIIIAIVVVIVIIGIVALSRSGGGEE